MVVPNSLLRTGISDNTDRLEITPGPPETSSQLEQRLARGGKNLNKAAEFAGIIKRSKSLPDISCELHENTFYSFYKKRPGGTLKITRSRSLGNLLPEDEDFITNNSLSPWSNSGAGAMDLINNKLKRVKINNGPEEREQGVVIIGEMASKSLLEEMATPGGMGEKRYLKFSPDTPRGRFDKVSIMELEDSPHCEEDKTGGLVVGEKVVKRILRGRRLFQHSPKQLKTSPGVDERLKKKTPLLEKKKTRTKLTNKLNTPPLGQPLITRAFGVKSQKDKGEKRTRASGEREGYVGGMGVGVNGPFGWNSLHGLEKGLKEIEGEAGSAPIGEGSYLEPREDGSDSHGVGGVPMVDKVKVDGDSRDMTGQDS